MAENRKIAYQDLKAGQEFPAAAFQVDSATASDYLKAVEEDSVIYQNTGLVPPMAVAALALKALINAISMPPGTIHVSQEFEFMAAVSTQDTLTSRATVSRIQPGEPAGTGRQNGLHPARVVTVWRKYEEMRCQRRLN
jgi:acyl dehydratase